MQEDTRTQNLSLVWQDTNIYLELTVLPDGKKFLYVNMDGAASAGVTTDGTMENFTTSRVEEGHSDAGACITSPGSANFATVATMLKPNSAESNE